jgi:hypothetical protein
VIGGQEEVLDLTITKYDGQRVRLEQQENRNLMETKALSPPFKALLQKVFFQLCWTPRGHASTEHSPEEQSLLFTKHVLRAENWLGQQIFTPSLRSRHHSLHSQEKNRAQENEIICMWYPAAAW